MAPDLGGHEDVARVHEGQVVAGVRDALGGLEGRAAQQQEVGQDADGPDVHRGTRLLRAVQLLGRLKAI